MVVVSPNFSAPEEGILFQSSCTKLLVNGQEFGTGSLYITENNVVWGGGVTSSGQPLCTISMLYPTIAMHALQREPTPALMVVVNYDLRLPGMATPDTGAGDADDDDDDDEYDPDDPAITELKFLPQNEADVVAMYTAMCHGQELHPDPQDVEEDHYMDGQEFDEGAFEDGEDEEFEDAEESSAEPEDAAARLRQLRLHNGAPHDENHEEAE